MLVQETYVDFCREYKCLERADTAAGNCWYYSLQRQIVLPIESHNKLESSVVYIRIVLRPHVRMHQSSVA
jgi:hypothetical protein